MGSRNRQCLFYIYSLPVVFLAFNTARITYFMGILHGHYKNCTWIRTIRLSSICAHDLRIWHMDGTCNTHKVQCWTVGRVF